MKIKKIIDLCKKSGTLCLYEGAAAQWISDGSAFYPLYDVPGFDENTLCRTFDITEKQQSKIRFGFDVYLPAAYCFDDHTEGEILCEQSPVSIGQGTSVLIACRTTRGIMFLDRKYLVPLENTAGRMPASRMSTPTSLGIFRMRSTVSLVQSTPSTKNGSREKTAPSPA